MEGPVTVTIDGHADRRGTRRALEDATSWGGRVYSLLETEIQRNLEPLLRRMDVPSRQEVHRLARRIAQIEDRLLSREPLEALDTQQYAALFWDEA